MYRCTTLEFRDYYLKEGSLYKTSNKEKSSERQITILKYRERHSENIIWEGNNNNNNIEKKTQRQSKKKKKVEITNRYCKSQREGCSVIWTNIYSDKCIRK